jgi:signal transduction histidine kinase/CheY-like chemotaxis protein
MTFGNPLQWKYATYFSLLVALFLAASGAIAGWLSYRGTLDAFEELQRERAVRASQQIARFFDAVEQALHWAASFPGALDDTKREAHRLEMMRLLRFAPAVSELRWIEPDGRESLFVSRITLDVAGSRRDWSADPVFSAARATGRGVGPVYFRKDSQPYLTLAVANTAVPGPVLRAEVDLKFAWDVISRTREGPSGFAYLVDAQGYLVAHPDISLVLRKTDWGALAHVRAALSRDAAAAGSTADARNAEGHKIVSAHARVEPLGWTVFVEQSRAEALASFYAILRTTGVLVLLGILASIAVSVLLARRMVRPIRALQTGATLIGAGHLEQRIEVHTGDELEELARRFNDMAARLQEIYATLEQRVVDRTRELSLANQAKTRFLAAASHDLRQPLHALGLLVYALTSKVDNPEGRQIVDEISHSVEALDGLFDVLLDISRLDAGIVTAERADFAIQTLFEKLRREFALEARVKGLRLRLAASGMVLYSDPALIERILRNLISNAMRYTDAGGVVVGCRRRGKGARIEVWDSGPGIPQSQQREIFQEFYQIGNPGRDRRKGLGLGLSIVDRLAGLLGHAIEVRSIVGRGSVFAFTVPRSNRTPAEQPIGGAADDGRDLSGSCVLVIDDEGAVLNGMDAILRDWGCRPILADSVEAALALLCHPGSPPDAIIADYRLRAGETGVEAIARIQSVWNAPIPAAIITGDTAADRLREAQSSGYPLLHKPVRPAALRALLCDLLRK